MQVTGEGACWPSVGREFKIASLVLGRGNQGSFSEGSSREQHSDPVDVQE